MHSLSNKHRLLPSSCHSVRLIACLSSLISITTTGWMSEILCCGLLWNSDRKLKIWLKLDKNMRHFAWRSKYIYCYRLYKFAIKASFCNSVFVLLTVACSSTIHMTYFFTSIIRMVTRTLHNVALHIYCLSCFKRESNGPPHTIQLNLVIITLSVFATRHL